MVEPGKDGRVLTVVPVQPGNTDRFVLLRTFALDPPSNLALISTGKPQSAADPAIGCGIGCRGHRSETSGGGEYHGERTPGPTRLGPGGQRDVPGTRESPRWAHTSRSH